MSARPQSLGILPGFAHNRRTCRDNTWSSDDLNQLRGLAETGAPVEVIAMTLRRTPSAVRNKAGMHGISLKRR